MGLTITANRLNELYGVAAQEPARAENAPAGNNINNINNPPGQGAQGVNPGEVRGELTRLMRSIAGESFSNVTQADLEKVKGRLSNSDFKALKKAVENLGKDLSELSKMTGAELAAADEKTLAKLKGMIDRQMEMSEFFMEGANQLQDDKDLRNQLFDMSLKCSSRASELGTLIMQMSAVKGQVENRQNQVGQQNQPNQQVTTDVKDQLFNRSADSLMKGMAATMHGNDASLNSEAAQVFGEKLVQLKHGQKEVVSQENLAELKTSAEKAGKEMSLNLDASFGTAVKNRFGQLKSVGASSVSLAAENAFKCLGDPVFRKCMTDPNVLKHLAEHDSTGFLTLCSKYFLALDELSVSASDEQRKAASDAYKAVDAWLSANRIMKLEPLAENATVEQKDKFNLEKAAIRERKDAVMTDLANLVGAIRGNGSQSASRIASAAGVEAFAESLRKALGRKLPEEQSQAEYLLGLNKYAVSYTFAHVKNMLKEKDSLNDKDLRITGGDVLSVVSAKGDLSTWLETRVHGIPPEVIDERLVGDVTISSDKPMGAGKSGGVVRFVYEKGDDVGQIVFKPEINGRISMSTLVPGFKDAYGTGLGGIKSINVNVAANKVADVLGFGHLLVKSGGTVHNGTLGLTMDVAGGYPAEKFTSDNWLSINDLKANSPDKFKALQNTLLRQTTDLQWLDLLIGQGDRHWNNYMIDADFGTGTAKVTGIDNDLSFPAYRTGLTKFRIDPGEYRGKRFMKYFTEACDKLKLTQRERNSILNDYLPGFSKGSPSEIDTGVKMPPALQSALHMAFGLNSTVGLPLYMSESMYKELRGLSVRPEKLAELENSLKTLLPAKQAEATIERFRELIEIAETYRLSNKVLKDDAWMDKLERLSQKKTFDSISDGTVQGHYLLTSVCPAIRDCSALFGVTYEVKPKPKG